MRILLFSMLFCYFNSFSQDEGAVRFRFHDSIVKKGGKEQYTVTFTNDSTKVQYVLTNSFDLPMNQTQELPVGKYTMKVQSTSFQDFELRGFPINAQRITFFEEIELEEKSPGKPMTIKEYQEPPRYKFCG